MINAATVLAVVTITSSFAGPRTSVVVPAQETGAIVATAPWVRPMPMAGRNTGAYVSLENTGSAADALVAAESDAAEAVELHEMAVVNEMMRMRQVDRVQLPAGKTVALEPGGLHIMLIRLTKPIADGATIEITLRFASGARQTLEFVARVPDAMPHGG